MRSLSDLLAHFYLRMRSAATDIEKFDVVKDVDAQLQRHLDYCPSLKPSAAPYPANIGVDDDFDYLPCARYTSWYDWLVCGYSSTAGSTLVAIVTYDFSRPVRYVNQR